MADVSRRNVAMGAAWAVPAVAIVSTLPAYAVSPSDSCPSVRLASCTPTSSSQCSSGTYYPWATVTSSISGNGANAVLNIVASPKYQIATNATPNQLLTFTETLTIPSGWARFISSSNYSGTVGTGVNAPSVPAVTAVDATHVQVTWSFTSTGARCYCFGPVVQFAVPVKGPVATTHTISYDTARIEQTVGGVKTTCVAPTSGMKLSVTVANNNSAALNQGTLGCVTVSGGNVTYGISNLNVNGPTSPC